MEISYSLKPVTNLLLRWFLIASLTAFHFQTVKAQFTNNPETPTGVLPVIVKSFTGVLSSQRSVELYWTTLQEINCDRYEIERSIDGKIYVKSGTVKGNGFTSLDLHYQYSDDIAGITGPIIYYRLRQIDIDGKSSFSKVLSIRLKQNSGFSIAPNPFSSVVNLNIEWKSTETATLRLFNNSGLLVLTRSLQLLKGVNFLQLNDLSTIAPGHYFLEISSQGNRMIKQVSRN